MKRFAANYILVPTSGFLKQWVVETGRDNNETLRMFPLREEQEAVSWLSGVIVVVQAVCLAQDELRAAVQRSIRESKSTAVNIPPQEAFELSEVIPVWVSLFDFEEMRPKEGARYVRLDEGVVV